MVEKIYRGSIAALPSNRLLRFEGKAGNDQGIKSESVASGAACISDIFLHRENRLKKLATYILDKKYPKSDFKEKLLIYPNMVEIRSTNPAGRLDIQNEAGQKTIITEFSKKSRREFIKYLCKIKDKLILWQDFTFADDVMQIKAERKEVSNKALNRFRRIVLNNYPSIKIVYKREWEPRKSGNLKGEHIPHFHMFISFPNMNEDHEIFTLASELATIWVRCTKTKEIVKSLSVALHAKSYRIIKSQKQALKYATKYITKPGENWAEESIGRSWGRIGELDKAKPEIMEMTPTEMVHVKRRFRKLAPKRHPLQKALRKRETPTFLIVQEKTVNRIIEHTQQQLESECCDYFDLCANQANKQQPTEVETKAQVTGKSSKYHREETTNGKVDRIYRLKAVEK